MMEGVGVGGGLGFTAETARPLRTLPLQTRNIGGLVSEATTSRSTSLDPNVFQTPFSQPLPRTQIKHTTSATRGRKAVLAEWRFLSG